jgi:septum formation protein
MDKAGAYALQGRASLWIPRISGSYSSVIGLPLYLVRRLLILSGYSFAAPPETIISDS